MKVYKLVEFVCSPDTLDCVNPTLWITIKLELKIKHCSKNKNPLNFQRILDILVIKTFAEVILYKSSILEGI